MPVRGRGTDLAEFVDPYVDSTIGLLHNLVGAHTKVELDEAEADLVHARRLSLHLQPIPATGDLAEFRVIHLHLFQDVFAWAGALRTVDIRKNTEGAEYFVPVSMIERAAHFASEDLQADDFLRGMDRPHFIERLAHHYDQLNYIHPFREGNGRAQRALWDRIALDAGWRLNWLGVTGGVNDKACKAASEQRDIALLIEMFEHVVESRR